MLEAEIRMTLRPQRTTREMPIRFVVSNFSGYFLNIHIYKEVTNYKTGIAYYRSYDPANPGPLHGHSILEVENETALLLHLGEQSFSSLFAFFPLSCSPIRAKIARS